MAQDTGTPVQHTPARATAPAPGSRLPRPPTTQPAAGGISPPPRLRRRPALYAVGIALIALGGLVAGWAVTTVGDVQSVLAMRATVDRGTVISAGDLTVARVNLDPALRTIPAEDRDRVIGKRAAVDLAAGTNLTPDSVTTHAMPPEGRALVGVALTSAQLPAYPLRPGDTVRIVETPRTQDDPPRTNPPTTTATVVGTRKLDTGQTVVDVSVPSGDAAALAARAATGRVALVLDSGTP